MSTGWSLLERARKQAEREPTALARVEWLANGLKQVDLVLAAEKAYEHGADTGDRAAFEQAHKALGYFRARHREDVLSDVGFLTEAENRVWKTPPRRE